ncbi:hypothetical protein ACFYOV_28920 [Streptomyces sp. NPDC005931]|uniref:hypothetical protein n=1 Tax=Streptomyces sp. NPDC005931 TaxID=3364737 RepID=UPI0036904D53
MSWSRGDVTEIRDNAVYLSVDDLGISLRQRIAYTETSLPSPAAAAPISPTVPAASVASVAAPAAAQPAGAVAGVPAAGQAGHPPAWWEQRRAAGWHRPAARTPADAVSPNTGP